MKKKGERKNCNPPAVNEGCDSSEKFNPLSFDYLGRDSETDEGLGARIVTDPDGIERAWAHHHAPQTQKELKEALSRIETLEADTLKKSELRKTPREYPIRSILRKLRVKLSGRSQQKLAALVDEHLKGINKKLSEQCPKTWIDLGLPTHLEDVFKFPKKYPTQLLRNVKSYISKSV